MKRTLMIMSLLACLTAAPAMAANDQQFFSIYGGYSINDSEALADDSYVYGFRWGGESPAAGGQLSVEINHDGDFYLDTMLFSVLWNFVSKDSRTRNGRIFFNRFSAFSTTGVGFARYENLLKDDTDFYFAYEVGVGLQYRFSRVVGVRLQTNVIGVSTFKFINYEGTLGLAFYW